MSTFYLHPVCPENIRCMGAICGDIVGSVYEFHPIKHKDFNIITDDNYFTDDTAMTLANMLWLTNLEKNDLVECMHQIGNKYNMVGYGGRFYYWLMHHETEPYNSFGNGSAMRVSPVAWVGKTLDEVLLLAKKSAEVTHNHPEGIKGAQATAAAIFMARKGCSKKEIKAFIEDSFGYNLSRKLDNIRPDYSFEVSCQKSVPESIICFLESTDFEDTLRNAISLGGDADTMAAIAGAIAEAYYGGIPEDLLVSVWGRMPEDLQNIILDFWEKVCQIPQE